MRPLIDIAQEINTDISNGVYESFPKMKDKLSHISKKIVEGQYIINADRKLNYGEVKYLAESGYIDFIDIDDYFETQIND